LRFSKDKRGYENTFLVQPSRRKGKGRTRILYWFRTPPGVRVGRGPLDEEAIRLLEATNPDLEFDWTRILKGQPALEPEDSDRRGGREPRDRGRERDRERPRDRESGRKAPTPAPQDAAVQAASPEPAPIEEPTSAAHARLGSEGLARLRARHSEMLARISDRVSDPDRQEQLKSLAERLNPDAWVTETDVGDGLESYEATFAALRAELTQPRPPAPPVTEPAGDE
jgi:hypothetical protein